MRESVIANHVARLHDLAGDVMALPYVASDQKKSRAHVMLGESLQQAQRVRVVGAIVVSKRKLLRPRGEACERAAVPLSGGSHGLVSRGDGSRCGRSGYDKAEHGRIVADWEIGETTVVVSS